MRRKDREITGRDELIDIFEKADVCRIAIGGDKAPYIVPLNFGYRWEEAIEIYFHCAIEGRKLELLARNNNVCFEMDIDHELVKGAKGCSWGMKYKSVIGTGIITEVTDTDERKRSMDLIMRHYGYAEEATDYEDKVLAVTKILKLEVEEISGKQRI